MKTKFLLTTLLIAILLVMTTIVSAVSFSLDSTSLTFNQVKTSAEFTLKPTNSSIPVNVSITVPEIKDEEGKTITITALPSSLANFNNDTKITVAILADYSKLFLGKVYTGNLVIKNAVNNADNVTLPISISRSYCINGVQGNKLDLSVEINNIEGFGEEDNEWYPLDKIKVDTNVENAGTDSISNIVIEWCLYNPTDGKCTRLKDKENDFRLRDGADKDVAIEFQVNPDDLENDVTDYTFYLKAYSKDSEYGEDKLCAEYSEDISIMKDDSFVILSDISVPETVPCGEFLEGTANIWNIGSDDENDVYVTIYNKDLGIDEKLIVGDLNELESKDISFKFQMPKDAESNKAYSLEFEVFDQDDNLFENDAGEEAKFNALTKIEGNCIVEKELAAEITAELEADTLSEEGKPLTIKGTLKNTGQEATSYSLSVSGYTSWAELDKIEPTTITLEPGKSADFKVYFNVNEDAAGEQLFTIKADYSGATTEQEVSVEIAKTEESNVTLTGNTIKEHFKKNWFVWVIVVINVVLIISIIVVARRIASSK